MAGRHLASLAARDPLENVVDAGFDRIAAMIAGITGAPAAMVSVLRADHERLPGVFGLPEPWRSERRLPLSRSIAARVVRQAGPLVTGDARADPSLKACGAIGDLGVVAYAGVPITARDGRMIGALAAFDTTTRAWSESELGWLETAAALAAAEVELHRRLHEAELAGRNAVSELHAARQENPETEHQVRGLEVLLDLSHRLAAEPDARRGVCQAATELGDATAALLWEPNPAATELVLTAEHNAALAPLSVALEPGASIEADTFLQGESRLVSAVPAEATIHGSRILPPDQEQTAFALEPVRSEQGTIGVLEVAWQRRPEDVPPSAAALVGLLGLDAAAAITRAQRTARLVAEARTDPLTSLPNRRAWDEALPRELAHAKRLDYPTCVAIADLDRFKEVNDRHGHAGGDRLLQALAGSWRAELRDTDLLARIGGDEFALVLPGTTITEAAEIAGRLRRSAPEPVSASIGVAEWDRRESATEFLARADRALYAAKEQRDRTVIAPGGTGPSA